MFQLINEETKQKRKWEKQCGVELKSDIRNGPFWPCLYGPRTTILGLFLHLKNDFKEHGRLHSFVCDPYLLLELYTGHDEGFLNCLSNKPYSLGIQWPSQLTELQNLIRCRSIWSSRHETFCFTKSIYAPHISTHLSQYRRNAQAALLDTHPYAPPFIFVDPRSVPGQVL